MKDIQSKASYFYTSHNLNESKTNRDSEFSEENDSTPLLPNSEEKDKEIENNDEISEENKSPASFDSIQKDEELEKNDFINVL